MGSLDEGGVNIEHDGDRHLARTHSRLGSLKRHRFVCMTPKDAVPVGVLVLFELVEMAVLKKSFCQQLHQYHLHPVFKESDILLAIAFLMHVKDIHLPVLDSPHQPLMHVVINLSSIEFRIFQHILNEILRIPGVHSLQFLKIQKNALASCEGATAVRVGAGKCPFCSYKITMI